METGERWVIRAAGIAARHGDPHYVSGPSAHPALTIDHGQAATYPSHADAREVGYGLREHSDLFEEFDVVRF